MNGWLKTLIAMVLFGLLLANDGTGNIEEIGQDKKSQSGHLLNMDGSRHLNFLLLKETTVVA
jgi:hypothetical protein